MNKKLSFLLTILLTCISIFSFTQKQIEIEDLYKKGVFRQNYVFGIESMKDGEHYTNLNMPRNSIIKYSYNTGKQVEQIFNAKDFDLEVIDWIFDYQFSADETKILISFQYEPIYRHSYLAEYLIYNIKDKSITRLSENGKQQLAFFSPDGNKIAFVRDNNIFVKNISIENSQEIKLTNDGERNKILNGAPDWVYEEEFSYNKAYDWSADSKKIAFLKSDESEVKTFTFPIFGNLYPENYEFKYPKAGEDNSKISLHIIDIETKQIIEADLGDLDDMYIPRLMFTQNPEVLAAVKMNRLQNKYELFSIDANTGKSKIILTLTDPKYIEINDDLKFLNDKKHFVYS
ncbi:MAG: DPP IV N-terminal domain-containing protein, partial [Bacteroidales bacterium]|nr:DPP IV N-terminal domain-containing protein [Bacteroidales bacterium]